MKPSPTLWFWKAAVINWLWAWAWIFIGAAAVVAALPVVYALLWVVMTLLGTAGP